MKRYLVAIDPGTTESGVCILDTEDFRPLAFAKIPNENIPFWIIQNNPEKGCFIRVEAVIERMYNPKSASSHVFLACEWIGRFDVELHNLGITSRSFIMRWEEYRHLCGKEYAHNDKGVRNALVDRFAYGQRNYGKGTVMEPGWFHGFSNDIWQAYAIGVAFIEKMKDEKSER